MAVLRAEFKYIAVTTPPGAGTHGLLGFFTDSDSLGLTASDIKIDESFFYDSDGKKFIVKSKTGTSPLSLGVDPIGHSIPPSTGIGQLTDSNSQGAPYYSGGVTSKVQSKIFTDAIDAMGIEIASYGDFKSFSNLAAIAAAPVQDLNTIIRNNETGAIYRIQSSLITGLAEDGISQIANGSNYAVLQPAGGTIVSALEFGINGVIGDIAAIKKLFAFCKAKTDETGNIYTAYFPAGTYQFDLTEIADYGTTAFSLKGDEGKTIFTTSQTKSIRPAERISLLERFPRDRYGNIKDGFYIADIVPNDTSIIPAEWSAISATVSIGDYIQIASGVASISSETAAVNAGFVVELQMQILEPITNGLYVVSRPDFTWGGGYGHSALSWEPTCLVMLGALVENIGGTWTRYAPGHAFNLRGDIFIDGVVIEDFATIPFGNFTDGGSSVAGHHNKIAKIQNCEFKYVRRAFAVETSGSSGPSFGPLYSQRLHDPNYAVSVGEGTAYWVFDSVLIENCVFDNIYFSAFHGWPTTRTTTIRNNRFQNCPNCLSAFTIQPPSTLGYIVVQNNTFENIANYWAESNTRKSGFRIDGPGTIENNNFIRTTGIHIRSSGDADIRNNTIQPLTWFANDSDPAATVGAGIMTKLIGRNMIKNEVHGGGNIIGVFVQSAKTAVIGDNKIRLAYGNRYITADFESDLDRQMTYIIVDQTAFETIIPATQRKPGITTGRVFFNDRAQQWEYVSDYQTVTGANSVCIYVEYGDASDTRTEPCLVDNCEFEGAAMLDLANQHDAKKWRFISNKVATFKLFGAASGIDQVELLYNILEFTNEIGQLDGDKLVRWVGNDVRAGRNSFVIETAANGKIEFINNVVSGLLKEDSTATPTQQFRIYFKPQGGNVDIIGNVIDSLDARSGCIRIDSNAAKVRVINNTFFGKINNSVYSTMEFVNIGPSRTVSNLIVDQNECDFDAITVTGATTIVTVSSGGTLTNLFLGRNVTNFIANLTGGSGTITNANHVGASLATYDNSSSGLVATTVQGAIDEVSVSSRAFMAVTGGSTSFISGTPERLDGDTPGSIVDSDSTSDWTVANSACTYTGTQTRKFIVNAYISGALATTGTAIYYVAKNGVPVGSGKTRDHGSTDIGNVALQWVVELSTNDTIEIYIDALANETFNNSSYNIVIRKW